MVLSIRDLTNHAAPLAFRRSAYCTKQDELFFDWGLVSPAPGLSLRMRLQALYSFDVGVEENPLSGRVESEPALRELFNVVSRYRPRFRGLRKLSRAEILLLHERGHSIFFWKTFCGKVFAPSHVGA